MVDAKLTANTTITLPASAPTEPPRIVIKPAGQEQIVIEITKADFQEGEDGFPTYLLERDYTKKDESPPPAP